MKVREIMVKNVISVHESDDLRKVMQLLARHNISGVPVVDDGGAVVGLISEFDLISRPGRLAKDVMTRNVITVTDETDVESVRDLLVDRRIRRVPVLSGSRLVGLVSRADVLRAMAFHWVCEACGEVWRGARAPRACHTCGKPRESFTSMRDLSLPND